MIILNLYSLIQHVISDLDSQLKVNEGYKKDVQMLNSRISSIHTEHRELRSHWLAEKNDLDTRLFQSLALQTQYQGITIIFSTSIN